MAQSFRAFTSRAEGLLFESELRQNYVVKTGDGGSTAKR